MYQDSDYLRSIVSLLRSPSCCDDFVENCAHYWKLEQAGGFEQAACSHPCSVIGSPTQ